MRGKKGDTEVLENYDEKRAPVAGFLGMRGKKGPLVSLYRKVSTKTSFK